jgi:hypothetical protein
VRLAAADVWELPRQGIDVDMLCVMEGVAIIGFTIEDESYRSGDG